MKNDKLHNMYWMCISLNVCLSMRICALSNEWSNEEHIPRLLFATSSNEIIITFLTTWCIWMARMWLVKGNYEAQVAIFLLCLSILITIIIIISQCVQITNEKRACDGAKDWSYMNRVLTKKRTRTYFYSIEIMSSNMYHSLKW